MDYDVVIVGAGPSGLMSAGVLAKKGVSVLVIEKRPKITNYCRASSGMFHNSEGMNGETVTFRRRMNESYWHFRESNFEVKYTGGQIDFYDYYVFSPSGYKLHMYRKEKPLGICFDMDALLGDLLKEAASYGASFVTSTIAMEAKNIEGGAKVRVKTKDKEYWISGKKVIGADGLTSKIGASLGFNEGRYLYAKGPSIEYTVANADVPMPPAWMRFHGANYTKVPGMIYMVPSAFGENQWKVGAGAGIPGRLSTLAINHFLKEGPYAHWFKNASIVDKRGCSVAMYEPVSKPYKGNVLMLGETVGFAETLVQGALVCGYRGANAVYDELCGKNGFEEYEKFWNNSFLWLKDPQWQADYAKTAFMYPFFNDEELDYMLKFTDNMHFPGELNPYKSPINFMNFMNEVEGIKPEILQKIKMYKDLDMHQIRAIVEKMKEQAMGGKTNAAQNK
ncbi:MAG: NAD(P)/FAD-dependent oxidoreductase [Candidatus Schekmanbacteria bacterium]|nr:MAG: NAD(P)/FAD-dependent oxidoreductase [Candidatus Schekmanbacteria bacterium]